MVRRFFLFYILLLVVNMAWAVPAKRKPFTVTNSDGSTLTITLCGDEHYHFYATLDGTPVIQEENGDWRLAPEMAETISATWTERVQEANARRQTRAINRNAANRSIIRRAESTESEEEEYVSPYLGKKKGIVILVNFQDKKMKSNHTQAEFNKIFNQVGYNENNHVGSVHDYFLDQSYGQFDLTFDVYGPVTTSHGYAYYGGNDAKGNDQHPAEMIIEACRLADKNYKINWKDYDWDNDSIVDQVYVIYAGIGEHASSDTKAIWPHEYNLYSAGYYGDGEGIIQMGDSYINTYATSCELDHADLSQIDGIGTACHEFSHCLGLPDVYDTSYEGGAGMDAWDLMASGSYNGKNRSGECPAGYTAFERWWAGWLDFTELDSPATITHMADIQDKPEAYVINNDGTENEFFTLENRQNKKWNEYVYTYNDAHGMLICHIDYDQEAWSYNTINNVATHQRVTFVPAGKTYGTYTTTYGKKRLTPTRMQYRSHLFPGSGWKTEFTDASHGEYGYKFYNLNAEGSYVVNKPLTNIDETDDGYISFDFMGGGPLLAIDGVQNDATAEESKYFTLGGIQVDKPTVPGIYIQKKGNETKKVVVY